MGAVTYPDPEVEQYLQQHFVPVQYDVVEHPEAMDQFNTPWTPTLIFQDPDGREHRRSQGYMSPRRLMAEMALARLKDAVDRRDYATANERAKETLERTQGDPDREPEAIYWASVAAYKATDESKNLIGGWNRLLDEFPQSDWAKKVEFIRM